MTDGFLLSGEALRFICDIHLGKLARWLRLLGFDTVYGNNLEDREIVRVAKAEHRIVLTRDGDLLAEKSVSTYRPASIFPDEQLRELLAAFNLRGRSRPFSRCMNCNGEIMPVEKTSVTASVPVGIMLNMEQFGRCQACAKIYWPGSHYRRMQAWMDEMLQ